MGTPPAPPVAGGEESTRCGNAGISGAKVTIVPTYEWTLARPEVMVPEGLQVRPAANGSGVCLVRIPPTWQLRVTSAPENETCCIGVTRRTTLAAIRVAVASVLTGGDVREVTALRVNGVVVASGCGASKAAFWAQTVEQLELFGKRVVCIIGSLSRAKNLSPPTVKTAKPRKRASPTTGGAEPTKPTASEKNGRCDIETTVPVFSSVIVTEPQTRPSNAAPLNNVAPSTLPARRRRTSWLSRHLAAARAGTSERMRAPGQCASHPLVVPHDINSTASSCSTSNIGHEVDSPLTDSSSARIEREVKKKPAACSLPSADFLAALEPPTVRRRRTSWLSRHMEAARRQQREARVQSACPASAGEETGKLPGRGKKRKASEDTPTCETICPVGGG
eukprot:TRINITY_DN18282_c0_g1_i1.p1 TRINITY_DN18282_c0_g1~~TRINITY_DN18282_c0_g1_i1.p1  ORF type:complete len:392 (+),score=56.86 TRINITY_DN18282_c0_g1_i1:63-1238(+)